MGKFVEVLTHTGAFYIAVIEVGIHSKAHRRIFFFFSIQKVGQV